LRRERWLTPDGRTVVAPLPSGITDHFGPKLRRFVLAQHHHGQVSVPRLVAPLTAIGLAVSKRQVVRLLIDRQDRFMADALLLPDMRARCCAASSAPRCGASSV
jgi:hypothetical protein